MIEIDDLSIMQDSLRNTSQICGMVDFVKNGGFWTNEVLEKFAAIKGIKKSPLMEIVKFPDERYMIHDGHHRIVSIYLAGRQYIRSDEYVQKEWNYDDYLKINFQNRWVTPFNPITEIRYPDIYDFKNKALELSKLDEQEAIEYILKNKKLYAKPRTMNGVSSLALTLGDIECNSQLFQGIVS